jgi:hypothetical protein
MVLGGALSLQTADIQHEPIFKFVTSGHTRLRDCNITSQQLAPAKFGTWTSKMVVQLLKLAGLTVQFLSYGSH